MKNLLEKKLLPFVIKPGRYAGGEPGQIIKDPDNRTTYLHAYPDKYEIGMSYVGLQTIYHIVNSRDHFICERVFAIDRDAEEIMRREEIPLFSLESSRPASDFDAIGFTLVDETVYTNVLAMLDLANIPLRTRDRTDQHPLILAGGPAVFNPEPLAPFVDVFFIGDAEEGLPEILEILHELRGSSREAKLEAICRRVESVYIPRFYDDQRKPTTSFAPETIKARVIPELLPDYYPSQPLLPLIETVHNHLGVEIMRGCPQGCRFCMAGAVYRPMRVRSKEDIIQQVNTQLKQTGYGEVTLLSLSTSDYPGIEALATALSRSLESQRISVSLPSLRPGTISPGLLDAVGRIRKGGLTIAPEAGSERLRLFIRKDFPDAAIYDTVRMAIKKGWTTIKLYFIIGLPTETEDDLLGITEICRKVYQIGREYDKKITLNVSLSPFAAKPHTPFQWDEVIPENDIFEKIKFIKRNTRLNQVRFKHSHTQMAMVAAALGRSDRRVAEVIESAFRAGCRFDGWGEEFDYDKWKTAFESCQINPDELLRSIPFSQNLPWSHIRKGVSVEHLRSERERTASQLKEYVSYAAHDNDENKPVHDGVQFGRGKKKVAGRNLVAPTKNRVRIRWGKTARYRYLSHLDNMRILERAIRRSGLPVEFSQGYNPMMKLSFGPPLPLGHTSETEYADITLKSNLTPDMVQALAESFPEGIRIYDAKTVLGKNPSLSSTLNRIVYTLPLELWSDTTLLQAGIDSFQSAEAHMVERKGKKQTRQIDIKPSVYDISIEEESLVLLLGIGDGGYVRPEEVLKSLHDGLVADTVVLPLHRREMYRLESNNRKIDPMEL
jgi:radical SAM family uncharacterized protein/radical SAM-linked protein